MSTRMANIQAKCSDRFSVTIKDKTHHGYVSRDLGIGGGDYILFDLCLDCGRIDGSWPLDATNLEISRDIHEE